MGRKLEVVHLFWEWGWELSPHLTQRRWAKAYLHNNSAVEVATAANAAVTAGATLCW